MKATHKRAIQLVLLFVTAYGLFAFGSYDARDELSVLTPAFVAATFETTLQAPTLQVPKLETPTLEQETTLEVPKTETPTLDTPTLETPDLDTPTLEVPKLDTPTLEVPKLDTPTLEVPTLDVPTLEVPELETPTLETPDLEYKSCRIYASETTVYSGSNVTIYWETSGFSKVTINGVEYSALSGSKTFTNITEATTYILKATTADGKSNCTSFVTVNCLPPVIKEPLCELYPATQTIKEGERATLSWDTTNANFVTLTDFGAVAADATNVQTDPLFEDKIFTLTAKNDHKQIQCQAKVYVTKELPAPTCDLLPEFQTITAGERATLSWDTEHADSVTITQFGSVADSATNVQTDPLFTNTTFTLTATGNGKQVTCKATVYVESQPLIPHCDTFTATPGRIDEGESSLLKWQTTNATRVTINNGVGEVNVDGSLTVSPADDITYILTAFGANNTKGQCQVDIIVDKIVDTVPKCVSFTANRTSLPVGGGNVQLAWTTERSDTVVINPILGTVTKNGTSSVTVLSDTVFTLTASDADGDQDSCTVAIDVEEQHDTVPQCVSFTANRTSLPVGGGVVALSWTTLNASNVTISPLLGAVEKSSTSNVTVTSDTTFTLVATDADGDQDSCTVAIDVDQTQPVPISCANNVNFAASASRIDEGDSVELNWSTTGGITSVSIDNGISSNALSGKETISLNDTTRFTLTASDGTNTIQCPLTVDVDGGGGGGGSSSPRCDLEISDESIRRGEEIELTWNTRLASDIRIFDDHGKVYIDTDDFLSSDKRDFFDGELTLSPSRDTEYTLVAERGRRERECTVEVEVRDDITVIERRDQQPLVAGISLTQVPYTGFEAGPILTIIFYILLGLWAMFVTYVLVVRRESLAGFSLGDTAPTTAPMTDRERAPELFVNSTASPVVSAPVIDAGIPANLPTGEVQPLTTTREEVTTIEDFAHKNHALLSSDAIAHFLGTTKDDADTFTALQEVIETAKATYPLEDEWVVINLERMKQLCSNSKATSYAKDNAPVTVPTGSGSLAEAIVTGNVVGAYTMIGNRPMIALADAATDLDALLRKKQGEVITVSALMSEAGENLSIDQLKAAINALTSALDGTYTSEQEAVKMAIMKAIKATA